MMVSDGIRAQWIAAAQAQANGQLRPFSVAALPLPPGSGLVPVSPALLAPPNPPPPPTPAQLEAAARTAISVALGVVRAGGPVVAGAGALVAASAPVIGVAGRAAAPALASVPYVGPALAAVAAVAEPIAAVTGTVVGAGGAVASAAAGVAPDPLVDVGTKVVQQLDALANANAAEQK